MTNSLLARGRCLNKVQFEQVDFLFKGEYFMLMF